MSDIKEKDIELMKEALEMILSRVRPDGDLASFQWYDVKRLEEILKELRD